MLQSIKNTLSMLDAKNIVYCHWKSNQHLGEALNGNTDLDILCKAEQRGKVDEVLNQCGLKRFRSTPLMQYNAIEDFIGFDRDTARIWHLHLHYRLTLGEKHLKGYTTPWANSVLDNRIYDNSHGIYCACPEDEYFLILLRMALKLRWRDYFRAINQDSVAEINWLKERTRKEQIVAIAQHHLGDTCSREYARLLDCDLRDNRELFKLQQLLWPAMRRFSAYNKFTSYISRTRRELAWLAGGVSRRTGIQRNVPSRRVSPSGGAVVAILGSDGAGKSTTITYITKEFSKKIDVKSVYLGSGDGSSSILRRPLRFIAQKVSRQRIIHGENIVKENPKPYRARTYRAAKIVWAIFLAQEKRQKLKHITKARNNGILVVTDRYPQIVEMGINDGPLLHSHIDSPSKILDRIARWERSIYESAYLNPPDLLVKLVVPTGVALDRKPGMSASVIETKRAVIERIDLGTKSVVVDTTHDRLITFGEIMEHIWNTL